MGKILWGIIGLIVVAAAIDTASRWEIDWYNAIPYLWGAYGLITIVSAICSFIAVWLYAINEKGVVVGGTLGAVPAVIAAGLTALLWPIAAGLSLIFLLVVGIILVWSKITE